MRVRLPTSRASFAIRFSAFDAAWAFLSPWLALWIRGAQVLSSGDWSVAAFYGAISFIASLIAFLVFRLREGMTHLFSVHDALKVANAVLLSEFLTYAVLFSVTRLDGIPRSTPIIHALILAAGLVIVRAFVRMFHSERDVLIQKTNQLATDHIIMIGSNRLSSLYISLLRTYAPGLYRIVAVLADRPEMIGRSIANVRIVGPTNDLLAIVEEFKEHGMLVNRIIVGGDSDFLAQETLEEIERICNEYKIQLDFIPQLIGLDVLRAPLIQGAENAVSTSIRFSPPRYFQVKRYIDFFFSLLLILILLPVLLAVATVVLLDVGSPVFFWQRRIGMNGQSFQMHKFRTLKPSFDWRGRPVASTERLSWIGDLLRKFRIDELPQLLNVLVGDMSLIGPRPLLPHDQPSNSALRLTVRPGITGWAQVNGGKLLTAEEKNALDEWYIRNASFWLDLKIFAKTLLFVCSGEHQRSQIAETSKPGTATADNSKGRRSPVQDS